MPTLCTIREPDPYSCLDREANAPIPKCVACGEVERCEAQAM